MRRIDRIAVDADVLQKTAPLLKSGAVVVMFEAERTEGAVSERLPTIPMRWMVIGDDGGGHPALALALGAERLSPKLMASPPLPHRGAVPSFRVALRPVVAHSLLLPPGADRGEGDALVAKPLATAFSTLRLAKPIARPDSPAERGHGSRRPRLDLHRLPAKQPAIPVA
jgi:hypothetical protein